MIKRTICIENPCHLKCRNDQLVLNYEGIRGLEQVPEKTVPVEDIGIVVLDHQQITVSHFLLDRLLQNNAAVITCNATHHPNGMLLNLDGNTVQSERFRVQIEASEPLKKQLWQQTVRAKIQNQCRLLERLKLPAETLKNYAEKVRSGDADNLEARAAGYYWQYLFPPTWKFFRKRDGPPPNNLLNYGYAILRATVARALVGSGLLPTLGIFHRSRYNAFCLADDVMEPYRPFVDSVVRGIIDRTSNIETLTSELKVELLRIPALDVQLKGETSPLFVAVQRTSASLARCFLGQEKKILYPRFP
ncbi:MAG TPA: type II CRISPR-associated endonuclease Cas1 [Chitinophagaceae bacterium]|nr:type II CRISPR-associated endonuclease Cas1 [Chitinophagaceae bacterium]